MATTLQDNQESFGNNDPVIPTQSVVQTRVPGTAWRVINRRISRDR